MITKRQMVKMSYLPVVVLILILIVRPLHAQDQTVRGQVTDAQTNENLPGVNVVVKGTTTGTFTNTDGVYSLTVSSPSDTLVFSFVGYEKREIPVNSRSTIDVTMTSQTITGEELVVVGYGTTKQGDLTGSVSNITSEDFNQGANVSTQQLIQGKLSGVNITKNSGKPGGSTKVRIRGGTSITASNDPLYVIDGVPISTNSSTRQVNITGGNADIDIFDQEPVDPLDTINPSDIKSITVLKDASATAIYGSRGANGVIVVTTKSGVPGSIQTNYSTRFGVATVADKLDILTADEWRQAVQDIGLNGQDMGANTNWQDKIFRQAFSQNHNLSVSGGNSQTQYRGSLGYGTQDGVIDGSDEDNASARININHSAIEGKLHFDLRLTTSQLKGHSAPISNTVGGESGTNMLYDSYVFNPTFPVYDDEGNFTQYSQFTVNPLSYNKQIEDERTTKRILGSLSTTYDILEFLSANVNLGYTSQDIGRNSYIQKASPLGGGLGGLANTQNTTNYSNLLETTLAFNRDFGDHSINAIAGYSYQYFVDNGLRARASGFISDQFKYNSLQAASTVQALSSYKESNTLISYYSRVNYSYKDKYLVTATIRRDGSSRFGSGNKYGIFPSGSVAWRVSDESFFPQDGPVNDLKFRVSYGITGNQEIGNYNSLTTLGASTDGYVIGGTRRTIVLPQQYANPDLKWEETSQLNTGLDIGLFDGRLTGKIDYYIKDTSDLLLSFAVPSPSVVSTQLANVGEVKNKGIEVEIGSRIIQKKEFLWVSNANFSANRNKVVSLSNDNFSTDRIDVTPVEGSGLSGVTAQIIRPGDAIGTFYGPKFLGIKDGVEQVTDKNMVIGNAQPDFLFGWSNSFSYKNWDLNFNIRGSIGSNVLNLTALNLSYLSNLPGKNVLASGLTDGLDRNQPKKYSSRWIEDGSFVRLDNLTLGYTFDVNTISFLSNARIYLTGQNLFLITKYSGLDPEVNSDVTGEGTAPLGVDYLAYPRARTFSIGASLSF